MLPKPLSIAVLILSQIAVLAVWFSSAAVFAELKAEFDLTTATLAWMSTATQVGFGLGALGYAAAGLSDRYDPRVVFAISAVLSAGCNALTLVVQPGGTEAIILRALTGAFLAGVYPVGMKIAVGWAKRDRALLVSALVGALTLGSAAPHLIALTGGADWRWTITLTSVIAAVGGLSILLVGLGPYHARAPRLDVTAITLAWTNRRIRYAILGYIGHMWELYAFWAWIGVIAGASYAAAGHADPGDLAKLTAFLAIALGAIVCIPAGRWADRTGKGPVASRVLAASGFMAVVAAFAYGGPIWLVLPVLVIWGILVIPDSALFSSLVADAAPPERAGSIMTLQNALGFLLTALTVQMTPLLADTAGWVWVIALLALGPAGGVLAMRAHARAQAEHVESAT